MMTAQIKSDKPDNDLEEALKDIIERNKTEKEALLKVLKFIENQKKSKKNSSKNAN